MNEAFRLVMGGAELVGIHKGRYLKSKQGLELGPGPYIAALEFASGKAATVVGKPESAFFSMALGMAQVACGLHDGGAQTPARGLTLVWLLKAASATLPKPS